MMNQTVIEELDQYGFYIFNDVLPEEQCEDLACELDKIVEEQKAKGLTKYINDMYKHVWNLPYKSDKFLSLVDHPKALPYLEHYLGEDLILGSFNARHPVAGQRLHSDSRLHCESKTPLYDQTFQLTVLYVLDDFLPETGSTRIIPGSNHWGGIPQEGKDYKGLIQVTVPRGSLILLKSHVWHSHTENTAGRRRWAIIGYYSMWFIKQNFDFTRNYPKDLAQKATPRQLQLLGFHSIPPTDEFEREHTKTSYPVFS